MTSPKCEKKCPLCPWIGVNRYNHMKIKHGKTMSDFSQKELEELERK